MASYRARVRRIDNGTTEIVVSIVDIVKVCGCGVDCGCG